MDSGENADGDIGSPPVYHTADPGTERWTPNDSMTDTNC